MILYLFHYGGRRYVQYGCCSHSHFALRGVRSIVISMSVCLSVCPLAYLENYTAELHQIFWACRLWLCMLSPPVLPVLWMASFSHHRLFDASCIFLSGESITAETNCIDFSHLCSIITIRKCTSWVAHAPRAKSSAIRDCLV